MLRVLFWVAVIFGGLSWYGSTLSKKPATSASTHPIVATSTIPVKAPITAIPGVQWRIQTDTSAIDDSKSVYLQVTSDNDVAGKYGGSAPATLLLRCMENTTSVMFKFNDHFMADIQGYGDITFRIDDRKASKKTFEESTDNTWLGLWNGGSAIPFIKGMFGGERMVVRATPFNESAVEVTFRIDGLTEKIGPLQAACNW